MILRNNAQASLSSFLYCLRWLCFYSRTNIQMLPLHCNPPISLPQLHRHTRRKHAKPFSRSMDEFPKRRGRSPYSFASSSFSSTVRAEKGSREFELDPEQAKEALQKLDQQLQTLSKKQVSPPKIKASEVKLSGAEFREEPPEISGSFLAYLAVALLLFTIFYNVLFYTVIKPSVDGPETAPAIDDQSETASVFGQK